MAEHELEIKVCRFICDWEPDITINSVEDWLEYIGNEYNDKHMKASEMEIAKSKHDELLAFIKDEVLSGIIQ